MSQSNRKPDCSNTGTDIAVAVPAGTPTWITPELVERTIKVWQPHYHDVITAEEAVTMIQSVGRLFLALSSESTP